uniref:Uncharacterized protein n=1 Tax=Macaca fascicularis TaxID=9541 RepID=Q9BE90_MACFA|nr:hypothetical protein [Macaca fascicularis]
MKTREQLPPMKQEQSGYQEAEAVSPARGRISQVWDRLHFRRGHLSSVFKHQSFWFLGLQTWTRTSLPAFLRLQLADSRSQNFLTSIITRTWKEGRVCFPFHRKEGRVCFPFHHDCFEEDHCVGICKMF